MEPTWRARLEEILRSEFVHTPSEWLEIHLSPSGQANLTVISCRFGDLASEDRRKRIVEALEADGVRAKVGLVSLYTPEEADSLALSRTHSNEETVRTWHDLAMWAADAEGRVSQQRDPRLPRTVAFYSFKGGVGRTTAFAHVAWTLAARGRKVVAVDLDLEAPGLAAALRLDPLPEYGIVNYLYERAYLPAGVTPSIPVSKVFGEVRITEGSGRLFVVPAGRLSLDYLAMVDDLRAAALTEEGEGLWAVFAREIQEQVQPDIILVDARTGINEWGAFALLQAADKAVVFLFPNEQNREGADLLLGALARRGRPSLHIVFSPVPSVDQTGMEKVKQNWSLLQRRVDDVALEDGDLEEEAENGEDPMVVPYIPAVALADRYPLPAFLPYYSRIANLIDEETGDQQRSSIFANEPYRWKVVESLRFEDTDIYSRDPHHLPDLFQRTSDFGRFLDDTTCLIRGRKGTGKSALYSLLLRHSKTAQELARGRLDQVVCLSGHGRFRLRPTRDEFEEVDRHLAAGEDSWEPFWRSYLLVRLYLERHYRLRSNKYAALTSVLRSFPAGDRWGIEHTRTVIQMALDSNLKLLAKDALVDIDRYQQGKGQKIWLLFDDLDEDLPERAGIRNRALVGLFQLVQDADARRLEWIRHKIFLREDIWQRLTYDNKSHLNGRDIVLSWNRSDFLRLALRQTYRSREYRTLVDRFASIQDPDQVDEETLEAVLNSLWGSRRERGRHSKKVARWVYDRLTDAGGTTFPRSLGILLKAAKEQEMSYRTSHVQHPTDRLLRTQSLNRGLDEASLRRCEEITEEYPHLAGFFEYVKNRNFPAMASDEDLMRAWQESAQYTRPVYQEFVEELRSIGVLAWRENEQRYRFSDIYIPGFNLRRERGVRY